tara:strand:- start:1082 stop:1381 length:300 start_codon:yes stop_codon:yes gene_type:complete
MVLKKVLEQKLTEYEHKIKTLEQKLQYYKDIVKNNKDANNTFEWKGMGGCFDFLYELKNPKVTWSYTKPTDCNYRIVYIYESECSDSEDESSDSEDDNI